MLCHVDEGDIYLLAHGQKLALAASAEDFLRQFPGGDISYQLKFAVDYVHDGSIGAWVLNLWPPGMPWLNILILSLSGSGYFTLKIMALSTLLYALASYLVYRSLARGRFSPAALLACVLPMLYASFQNSIFWQLQIFSTDFYCFALLAILLAIIFDSEPKTARHFVLMAIALAALAYFRSFYFIFIKFFTLWSLVALAGWGGWTMLGGGWSAAVKDVVRSKLVVSVGMVLLFSWALLLPWMVVLKIEGKPFDWTVTDQVWAAQWRNDIPVFLAGMNTPCILEKNVCEQLMPFQYPDTWATPKLGSDFYKRLSIATFVAQPLKWYQEKAKVFHYLWFDGLKFDEKKTGSQLTQFIVSVILLAVCVALALFAVVRSVRNVLRHRPFLEKNELNFLFMIFCIYNVMVFTFAHYEPRYSVPLKWVAYLFSMFLLKDGMQKFDLHLFGINAKGVA